MSEREGAGQTEVGDQPANTLPHSLSMTNSKPVEEEESKVHLVLVKRVHTDLYESEGGGVYTLASGCSLTAALCSLCVRYEKQLQEEELSLQQQRRRLFKEVADEKERLAQLAAR